MNEASSLNKYSLADVSGSVAAILGIDAPAVDENATDEEIEAIAKAFVEKYAKYPIMVSVRMAPDKLVEAIYRQSRIILNA